MRELKFRVYRKGLSKYHYYDKYTIGSYHEEWSDDMLNAGIVEQYTGLKDNHGKEIYEGDTVLDERTGRVENVYYNQGGFCHFAIAGWEGSSESNDCVVIGNILEG